MHIRHNVATDNQFMYILNNIIIGVIGRSIIILYSVPTTKTLAEVRV